MRAALLALSLLAAPAGAQTLLPPGVDCEAPDSFEVVEMCGQAAFAEADAALNETYGLALTQARVLTERLALEGAPLETPAEEMLRDAQRAWVAFRDAACAAEATLGGTEAAELVALDCLTRLTARRAADLELFGTPE